MFAEVFEDHFESRLIAPEASLLHSLWVMCRYGRDIPEEEDIPAARLDYLRDDLMVLRPVESSDWLYEHYGRRIALGAGFDMTGRTVSDFRGPLRAFFADVYARVRLERRPLATLHRLGDFDERPLWERLILPVCMGGRISGLYVVNKVREREKDISRLFARARGRGMFILQFIRHENGEIVDARIIGANELARGMTNLRHDQLTSLSMLRLFPYLRDCGVWERYLEVGRSRVASDMMVDYNADGVKGRFAVHIAPYLDGVSVDFSRAEAVTDVSSSAA